MILVFECIVVMKSRQQVFDCMYDQFSKEASTPPFESQGML